MQRVVCERIAGINCYGQVYDGWGSTMTDCYQRQRGHTTASRLLASLLLVGLGLVSSSSLAQAPSAPHDDYGALDTITVHVQHITTGYWTADVRLTNDESVAAITLPFAWHPGVEHFRIDSATYAGLRTSYFALKTYFPDTVKSTILIGLISDLGTGLPPLEPGSGLIARLHFTSETDSGDGLTIDTTFIRPHNVLQLVTPDARSILPAFDTRNAMRHNDNDRSATSADTDKD